MRDIIKAIVAIALTVICLIIATLLLCDSSMAAPEYRYQVGEPSLT